MADRKELRRVCAGTRRSVLGESGTSKTAIAPSRPRAIEHRPRVLGSTTIEHDARVSRAGLVPGALGARARRVADEGLLIFDDPEPSRAQQQLLLDFTQFGTYRPLGTTSASRSTRVRIICDERGHPCDRGAPVPRDLTTASSVVLELPPLRNRKARSPRARSRRSHPLACGLLSPALEAWLVGAAASYPGNVGQLESVRRARIPRQSVSTRSTSSTSSRTRSAQDGTGPGGALARPVAFCDA
jgi:hypothetical protein